jgi:LPS O-antigen subunit length determinant protein (WzzB/FepE family)
MFRGDKMEITIAVVVFLSLLFVFAARNSFITRRFKSRFAKAFLEEFKRDYPESASLLAPNFGAQVTRLFLKNRRLVRELNALEMAVAKRPEISGRKSYAHFDAAYSRETQEDIVRLLKNKIEFADKIFNSLPTKARSQINRQAELIDKAAVEAALSDGDLKKEREMDEARAKHLGLYAWRFDVLMNIYDITLRANFAAAQ